MRQVFELGQIRNHGYYLSLSRHMLQVSHEISLMSMVLTLTKMTQIILDIARNPVFRIPG